MADENRVMTGRARMYKRAEELFDELDYEGWDGYGGYPLSEICYRNTVAIIEATDDDVLDFYNLFPSPNATFSFEARPRVVAAMSVGETAFSYAAHKDNEPHIAGKMDFDAKQAAEILSKMKNYHQSC